MWPFRFTYVPFGVWELITLLVFLLVVLRVIHLLAGGSRSKRCTGSSEGTRGESGLSDEAVEIQRTYSMLDDLDRRIERLEDALMARLDKRK